MPAPSETDKIMRMIRGPGRIIADAGIRHGDSCGGGMIVALSPL